MFHMHTCKACVKWIEKLTRQDSKVYDMLFERVLTCWFFLFLVLFSCFFFFLSWLSWLCVGEMSLRQVCVSLVVF